MRVIFSIAGPKDPGSHYFIDLKAGTIELASRSQPAIAAGELGDMRTVQYAAQDGTRLTGYLTLPPGRGPKNLPLVVMPHGGPESRDWISFHGWAQVLANRGYAVFQPNFRGSGGFGRAFAEAGHRQWGRLMQSDVSDGVSALIKDGTADAGRICIVGASYGGYAALAGGALTPQVYKCVVSIAGVSDLVEMVDAVRRETGSDSLTYKYWVKRVGDPSTDSAQMRSVSPSEHAADFRAPVLLVHGKDDGIVPLKQSLTMERALKSAGKSVKLVEIPLEGHHFARASSRLTLFKELEQFLYANIGN
jgi:dipeptidyl aminopeptidase/acylaminoacyl peptidase